MNKIETLLREEIADEFNSLSEMEVGSEAYKATVDGLVKLVDRAIEIEKHHEEVRKEKEARLDENHFKRQASEDEKKDRLIRNSIAVAGIVVPSLITIWGTLKTLKFEEEGTVTTIMGRGFINKLLPKK